MGNRLSPGFGAVRVFADLCTFRVIRYLCMNASQGVSRAPHHVFRRGRSRDPGGTHPWVPKPTQTHGYPWVPKADFFSDPWVGSVGQKAQNSTFGGRLWLK